jgi:hypothetical protein
LQEHVDRRERESAEAEVDAMLFAAMAVAARDELREEIPVAGREAPSAARPPTTR